MESNLEYRLRHSNAEEFKSEGEVRIARFLCGRGILYRYEQGVLVIDGGLPRLWHPDSFLPEFGVYIEFYGMVGDADYDKGIEKKQRVYAEMGIEVISVFPQTFLADWEGHILNRLLEISRQRLERIRSKTGVFTEPTFRQQSQRVDVASHSTFVVKEYVLQQFMFSQSYFSWR